MVLTHYFTVSNWKGSPWLQFLRVVSILASIAKEYGFFKKCSFNPHLEDSNMGQRDKGKAWEEIETIKISKWVLYIPRYLFNEKMNVIRSAVLIFFRFFKFWKFHFSRNNVFVYRFSFEKYSRTWQHCRNFIKRSNHLELMYFIFNLCLQFFKQLIFYSLKFFARS